MEIYVYNYSQADIFSYGIAFQARGYPVDEACSCLRVPVHQKASYDGA